jgi:hypothetical protein
MSTLSERERAQIRAASAEGKMEGVKHLLDIVGVVVHDDETRDRLLTAGHELLHLYAKEHAIQIDRFIASVRGGL